MQHIWELECAELGGREFLIRNVETMELDEVILMSAPSLCSEECIFYLSSSAHLTNTFRPNIIV